VIAPAFAVLLAALVAVPTVLLPGREQERTEHDVIASHARAIVAQHLVDVASSDHHTVKPWLSARLDFSPPVDPPAGSELLGARVDYVDGRPVATLVLRHAGHTVDHFVWPVAANDAAIVTGSERGFQLAHWTRAGMRHWVVSDLNAQEFAALVRSLQAQP
jgi:anti-sigma factor RsiW